MSNNLVIQLPWTFLVATSTTEVFVPVSAYYTAAELAKIAITMEIIGLIGNAQVKRAYQTCNIPSAPDEPSALGNYNSTNGINYPASFSDVATTMQSKQLVRFGWILSLSGGTTPASLSVAGKVVAIAP